MYRHNDKYINNTHKCIQGLYDFFNKYERKYQNLKHHLGAATFDRNTINFIYKAYNNIQINNICFHQICFRPYDECNEDNNRNDIYIQFQCMIIEDIEQTKEIVKESIRNLHNIFQLQLDNICKNPIVEIIKSNWKSKTLNAGGKGFECIINKLEVAQVTLIEKFIDLKIPKEKKIVEITYGVERLIQSMQQTDQSKYLFPCLQNKEYKSIIIKYYDIKNTNIDDILEEYKKLISSRYCTYDNFLRANILFNIMDSKNMYTEEEKSINIHIIKAMLAKINDIK